LEYAKSIEYLLNLKDIIKGGERRQNRFYDNKNFLNIKINWYAKNITAHADNSTKEYTYKFFLKEKKNRIKVQPYDDLKNYFDQIKVIYGNLQENYKYRLRANEAGKFFVREMEIKRKELLNGDTADRFRSIKYSFFKWLSFYGQSAVLPLFVWTPVFIVVFTFMRLIFGICSISSDHVCSLETKLIDSIAALLQAPRSNPNNDMDIIERVTSLPLIGLGIRNAIKSVFGFFSEGT
jgi:hypothetical protein